MIFFVLAVSINCIAIFLVIANAIYDAFTMQYPSDRNDIVNLTGVLLIGVVVLSIYLKNTDRLVLANILVWVPAIPLVLTGSMLLLSVLAKPDYK